MITSYEVGSIFRVVDQATPTLAKITAEVQKLDILLKSTKASLTSLGKGTGLAAASGQLTTVNRELLAVTRNANAAAAALARVGGAGVAAGRGSVPSIPLRPHGSGGQSSHGAGGPAGVRLSGISHGIPMPFGHASAHLRGVGTGAMIGVGVGAWGLGKTMQAGIEPLHQQAMLRLLGLSEEDVGRVTQRAWQTTGDVRGSSIAGNLKTMGEMYSIVGLEGAMSLSPHMATLDRVLASTGKGKEEGSAYVLTRAAELMGRLTDPRTHQVDLKGFGNFLDIMSKGTIATHGKISPAELLNYAKQAGPASGGLTGEGMMTTFSIIQAMGGNRAGTAAAALQRQFAGGIMSQRVAKELTALGIAGPGDFEIGRGGQVVAKSDAMQNVVTRLQADPLSAIADVIIPALESKGFDTNEKISREIYRMIGTGPAQREVYELIRGRDQIKQERTRMGAALPAGAALDSLGANDPEQGLKSFTTAFHNLMAAIGSPLMAAAIPTMTTLTTLFNRMGQTAAAHPDAMKTVFNPENLPIIGRPIKMLNFMLHSKPAPSAATAAAAPPAVPGGGALAGSGLGMLRDKAVQNNTFHIDVKAETDDPHRLAESILASVADLMAKGFTHSQTEGEGPLSSPFASGGG